MADHLAVPEHADQCVKASHTVTSFEPFTLPVGTGSRHRRIGLIATGSTTSTSPIIVAPRFASSITSAAACGWNIVTTSNPDAALNFGLKTHMEHAERYRRAREFYRCGDGLVGFPLPTTPSCATRSGSVFDPAKMHVLNHKEILLIARSVYARRLCR